MIGARPGRKAHDNDPRRQAEIAEKRARRPVPLAERRGRLEQDRPGRREPDRQGEARAPHQPDRRKIPGETSGGSGFRAPAPRAFPLRREPLCARHALRRRLHRPGARDPGKGARVPEPRDRVRSPDPRFRPVPRPRDDGPRRRDRDPALPRRHGILPGRKVQGRPILPRRDGRRGRDGPRPLAIHPGHGFQVRRHLQRQGVRPPPARDAFRHAPGAFPARRPPAPRFPFRRAPALETSVRELPPFPPGPGDRPGRTGRGHPRSRDPAPLLPIHPDGRRIAHRAHPLSQPGGHPLAPGRRHRRGPAPGPRPAAGRGRGDGSVGPRRRRATLRKRRGHGAVGASFSSRP